MKLDKSIFAHNAKAIRKLAGKTQNQMSEIMNCTRPTIGATEEARGWSVELVYKYSLFSGMSINFLLTYKIKIKK